MVFKFDIDSSTESKFKVFKKTYPGFFSFPFQSFDQNQEPYLSLSLQQVNADFNFFHKKATILQHTKILEYFLVNLVNKIFISRELTLHKFLLEHFSFYRTRSSTMFHGLPCFICTSLW